MCAAVVPVVDFAVVGGGIVGCAIAECLLRRFGTRRVTLLEKERRVAAHQSSHNSGVVHAGVYYTPGSLRARLCVDGARRMYAFAESHRIPHRRVGKLIVAVRADELPRLATLHERALANGVAIRRLDDVAAIRAIEPAIERPLAALHSPDSGIIDFSVVADTLARLVAGASEQRGELRLGFALARAQFDARDQIWLLTSANGDVVRARYLVTAAGLQSDRVAHLCGAPIDPVIVPVRGEWRHLLAPHTDLVRGLIYPVPDPKFPFLGVHFTPRLDGSVLVGPNAILAGAREAYSPSDVDLNDAAELARHPGVRALVRREFAFGAGEWLRSVSRRAHMRELIAYLPALRANYLSSDKLTGVRAQAMSRDGKLLDDFALDVGPHYLHVRNAPSPAATASLAIADHIVTQIQAQIALRDG
jgi:L-2-hydroxyglutarate oxidase LhgO